MEKDSQLPDNLERSFQEKARELLDEIQKRPTSTLNHIKINKRARMSSLILPEYEYASIILQAYPGSRTDTWEEIQEKYEYRRIDFVTDENFPLRKRLLDEEKKLFIGEVLNQRLEFRRIEFNRIKKLLLSFLENPLTSQARFLIEKQIIFINLLMEYLVSIEEISKTQLSIVKDLPKKHKARSINGGNKADFVQEKIFEDYFEPNVFQKIVRGLKRESFIDEIDGKIIPIWKKADLARFLHFFFNKEEKYSSLIKAIEVDTELARAALKFFNFYDETKRDQINGMLSEKHPSSHIKRKFKMILE